MDGIRHLSVSTLLSPTSNQANQRHPSQSQQDFLTSSSPFDRMSPAHPHGGALRPQGSYDMHMPAHALPSISHFDARRNIDNGGSSLRIPSVSANNTDEDNYAGSGSDDDDDTADCENVITDMVAKLELLESVKRDAAQFAKVRLLYC